MHEFSLASEIWSSVTAAARAHGGGRVLSVKLEIGALNALSDDQLRFWIQALAARDGSPGVRIDITPLPGRLLCRACGAESEVPAPTDEFDHLLPPPLACPHCASREITLTGGREIRVVSAELEAKALDARDTQ